MAYVDLNPIRSAMVQPPEISDYTSIQARANKKGCQLLEFGGIGIPYYLSEYIALVDYSGKCVDPNKRGYISDNIPDILKRLEIDSDTWVVEMKQFKTSDTTAVGTVSQLWSFCQSVKKKYAVGLIIPALE